MLKDIIARSKNAPKTVKILVYGNAHAGKTHFASEIPNSLLLDFDGGSNHEKFAGQIIGSDQLKTWQDIENVLSSIATADLKEMGIKTLVIDTLDLFCKRLENYITGADKDSVNANNTLNRSNGGYGISRQMMGNYFVEKLMQIFNNLLAKGVNLVFLAHQDISKMPNKEGVEVQYISPRLDKGLVYYLVDFMDAVLQISVDDEKSDGSRVLKTAPDDRLDNIVLKNRFKLPGYIRGDWKTLTSYIAKHLKGLGGTA